MMMTCAGTYHRGAVVAGARTRFLLARPLRRRPIRAIAIPATTRTTSFSSSRNIWDKHDAILPHSLVVLQRRCVDLRRTFATASSSVSSSTYSTDDNSLVQWNLDPTTRIGTITLHSPHNYNALSMEMGTAFSDLCSTLIRELTLGGLECHAIILQGSGNDAFSAGGPLEWLKSFKHNSVHHNADLMVQFYRKFLIVRHLPVPTIAALQGPAVGAGAGLALACDLRTAAPKPKILGLNFAKLGLHAGMGGSHLLEMALGGPAAKTNEILLLGQMLSGQQSYELGLVNRLEGDAKAAAHQMALEIGKQHPVAIRTMVQTLRQRQDVGLEAALQREALSQAVCYSRSDWGEGMDAVVEKRQPQFHGYHEP